MLASAAGSRSPAISASAIRSVGPLLSFGPYLQLQRCARCCCRDDCVGPLLLLAALFQRQLRVQRCRWATMAGS
jgi:hypothetical protein